MHGGRKDLRIMDAMKYMLREGGVKGLWRGNGVNVIKIAPESALKFGCYEKVKQLIKGDSARELSIYERFCAGSTAGAFSQTVIYPLEVMKTRLALRKTGEITGIFDCAKKIYKAEGVKVFYKGYWPNLFGIIPYAGIDLAIYETLKNKICEKFSRENKSPHALVLLGCGTFSSCCGQLAAYPFALIRTKLQSQVWQCCEAFYLKNLFTGWSGIEAVLTCGANACAGPCALHRADGGCPWSLSGDRPKLLQSCSCCLNLLLCL